MAANIIKKKTIIMRLMINEQPWKKEMNSESNQLSKSNYQFMKIQRFEKAEEYVNHTTEILLAMKNSTEQTTGSLQGKKKMDRKRERQNPTTNNKRITYSFKAIIKYF